MNLPFQIHFVLPLASAFHSVVVHGHSQMIRFRLHLLLRHGFLHFTPLPHFHDFHSKYVLLVYSPILCLRSLYHCTHHLILPIQLGIVSRILFRGHIKCVRILPSLNIMVTIIASLRSMKHHGYHHFEILFPFVVKSTAFRSSS